MFKTSACASLVKINSHFLKVSSLYRHQMLALFSEICYVRPFFTRKKQENVLTINRKLLIINLKQTVSACLQVTSYHLLWCLNVKHFMKLILINYYMYVVRIYTKMYIIIVKILRQITVLHELALSWSDVYWLFHNISFIEK